MARGIVKRFGKKYGFIRPDSGGPDVLVHIDELTKGGLEHLEEGQIVEYDEVVRSGGKVAATNIKVVGENRERGVVKWFVRGKEFGFITPNGGGRDVYVHISAVERAGLTTLTKGQRISYALIPDRKGPIAVSLRLEETASS